MEAPGNIPGNIIPPTTGGIAAAFVLFAAAAVTPPAVVFPPGAVVEWEDELPSFLSITRTLNRWHILYWPVGTRVVGVPFTSMQ